MRTCGECVKCCDGTLAGEVDGIRFGPGPCKYLRKGCTIYETRPDFCREFACEWLVYENVYPEEMRPDRIGKIIFKGNLNGVMSLFVVESCETAWNRPYTGKFALLWMPGTNKLGVMDCEAQS